MKIFIGAHYNLNNGDRALLEATVQLIKEMEPDCTIVVSAYEPSMISDERFITVHWPIKNGIREKIFTKLCRFSFFYKTYKAFCLLVCDKQYKRELKSADIVLMSGGHHLTDILGMKVFYKLASNFVPPIRLNKKVILLPQTIGPAYTEKCKAEIRDILKKASNVSCRDQASKEFIEDLKYGGACVVPDLVYSLKLGKSDNIYKKTVGVALYHSYSDKNKSKLEFTIKNLKDTIDELLSKGYVVKVIPMDDGDEDVYEAIYDKLIHSDKKTRFLFGDRSKNVVDIIEQFKENEFVLAYKTHSTVFSLICNTPVISVAYHPKSVEFMNDVGLGEYVLYDVDASKEALMKKIDALIINRENVIQQEIAGVQMNRDKIKKYFKETILNEMH